MDLIKSKLKRVAQSDGFLVEGLEQDLTLAFTFT